MCLTLGAENIDEVKDRKPGETWFSLKFLSDMVGLTLIMFIFITKSSLFY